MHHHQVEALEFVAVSGDIPELLFIDFHATGIGDGCIDKRIHSLKAPETFFVQFEQQLARAAAHIEYPVSTGQLQKINPRRQARFAQKKQHRRHQFIAAQCGVQLHLPQRRLHATMTVLFLDMQGIVVFGIVVADIRRNTAYLQAGAGGTASILEYIPGAEIHLFDIVGDVIER